jgi:hypothetical protein
VQAGSVVNEKGKKFFVSLSSCGEEKKGLLCISVSLWWKKEKNSLCLCAFVAKIPMALW